MPKVSQDKPVASKKSGVLGKIRPDAEAQCGLKICTYGKSGSGKTSFAGTFPLPLLRIRSPNEARRKSVLIKGADVVDPLTLADLKEIAVYQITGGKYATVVLDNMTDFQDMAIKEVLGVEEVPAQIGWGTVTQQQYGEVALYMKEAMRTYLAGMSCHIHLICQEREFNTEGSSDILAPYVNCALSPSIAGWIGPSVDYLCQAFLRMGKVPEKKKVGGKDVTINKEVVQFCLRTGPHPVYSTKFTVARGIKVPDIIINPDFSKVMAVINGKA